jgi:acetyl-CoA acyltransferase
VEAVRTPVGRRDGGLRGVHPVDLAVTVLQAIADRTGIDPGIVDDVIWGCVNQVGDQSSNVARAAVLAAGWPVGVPGTTVDRQCGSSQQAIHFAAAGLVSGQYDVVVAGGVESMSRLPMGSSAASAAPGAHNEPFGPSFYRRYGTRPNQGLGAEMVARRWGMTRRQLDEYALESHSRAAIAQDGGAFEDEIVPVITDTATIRFDEGVRRDGSREGLARLKTPFDAAGVVTAGNASQISDGSAALLMTTSENAARLGLRPIVRIHTAVVVGDDPVIMLTGPIPATRKALLKSGLLIDDIAAFEVNEAFAPVPIAWQIETGAEMKSLNPLGGAIALGHPLGGSGARLMTTLVHHMRHNGIRYGLQTMCEGGGMANATILELL